MFIVERVSITASNHLKTEQLKTAVNLPWCCGSGTYAELSRAALQLCARSAGLSQLHSAGGWAERAGRPRSHVWRLSWSVWNDWWPCSLPLPVAPQQGSRWFTKAALLQGWVFQKDWAPVLIKDNLIICWCPIGQNKSQSPKSMWEGTTQVCEHQGAWLGASSVTVYPGLSHSVKPSFSSVLDSSFMHRSCSTGGRVSVSIWDAVVNAPLDAVLGFHPGKYFLISIATFGCGFLKVPWSLIYSDKKIKDWEGLELSI